MLSLSGERKPDETFHPHLAGCREHLRRRHLERIAKPKGLTRPGSQQTLKPRSACDQAIYRI